MKRGLLPIKRKDHRTYDFHRTFGTAVLTPAEFNFDLTNIFPDQDLDGLHNGCTAYAVNDVASNDDKTYFDDQAFTYSNTKFMLGLEGDVPVDVMTALKSGTVYGVKKKSETSAQALDHRRSPYFIIKKNLDYFDGLVSAMLVKQGGLVLGTPWLPIFETVGKAGIIPDFVTPKNFAVGHCWEACGVKLIGNMSYIICKSWQGPNFGDRGYCYFNRKQINDLLGISGSGAFGQKHALPEDVKKVEMSIIETLISYLRSLITKLTKMPQNPSMQPVLPEEPILNQPEPEKDLLVSFCEAIRDYEGSPGNRNYRNNNPGNARYYSGGYASKYGPVRRDPDGFAIFKDYESGWLYLQNLVRSKIDQHPIWNFVDFFSYYAPASDGNDPEKYANFVAKRCGVGVETEIENLV